MTDRPFFDPTNPDWPIGEDGKPMSAEELTVAVYELVRRGLVDIHFDEQNRMWLQATPEGFAVYAIEEAMGDLDDDIKWPD